MTTPEPVDEFPAGAAEIRGGDRPEDYILPTPPRKVSGMFGHHEDEDDGATQVLEED